MTLTETIQAISKIEGVRVNEWKDRYYINLKGNGANYAGERSTKVWLDANAQLHIDYGKGTRSNAYDEQLAAVKSALNA